jgi:hypothetical protein
MQGLNIWIMPILLKVSTILIFASAQITVRCTKWAKYTALKSMKLKLIINQKYKILQSQKHIYLFFGLVLRNYINLNHSMTELKLSRYHQTNIELCYHKQRGAWLLYDDTTQPRQQIATISGSDLDGWQWSGDCPKLVDFWQQEGRFGRWRAALMDAAMAYIN